MMMQLILSEACLHGNVVTTTLRGLLCTRQELRLQIYWYRHKSVTQHFRFESRACNCEVSSRRFALLAGSYIDHAERCGREWGRERERQREMIRRQTDRQTENSNSKTSILKDSSVRSNWTYLTASPCYTTNTNKHDNTTNKYYKHD